MLLYMLIFLAIIMSRTPQSRQNLSHNNRNDTQIILTVKIGDGRQDDIMVRNTEGPHAIAKKF